MKYCYFITFILLIYSHNLNFNGPDYKASQARYVTQAVVCSCLVQRVEAAGGWEAEDKKERERERHRKKRERKRATH